LRERERERENIVCQLYNTGNLGMPDIYATQPAVDWLRKPFSTLRFHVTILSFMSEGKGCPEIPKIYPDRKSTIACNVLALECTR